MKIFFAIAAIITALNANAQWIQTTGPERGFVHSIVCKGPDVYAGTYSGGVFRLTNIRENWHAVNGGITSPSIYSLAVHDSYIFAGSAIGGVFRSSNDGGNWTAVNNGLTDLHISTLQCRGNYIYAGTSAGIFASSDNGANWYSKGLSYYIVQTIAFSDSAIYAGTYSNGIYRSTNGGTNWVQVNNDLTSFYINSLATAGNYIFAGTRGGLYRSSNAGMNWNSTGIASVNGNYIAVKGNTLFANRGETGIYKSTNYGLNWIQMVNGPSNVIIFALYTNGTELFAGTESGVYVSPDDGASWYISNNWFTNELVISMESAGPYIFAGTESNGLFRSTNEGLSWIPSGLEGKSVFALVKRGTGIYAGTVLSGGVYLSTDYGTTWTAKNSGLTTEVILTMLIKDSMMFAGTDDGVFRSSDGGNNWAFVNNGLTNNYIYALGANDNFIFAGSCNLQGDMFRSSDNGSSWTAINNGLSNKFVRSILASGSDLYAGTSSGVFLSTDNGDSWTSIGLRDRKIYTLNQIDDEIYAGTTGGVFVYKYSGKYWVDRSQGFDLLPWIVCLLKTEHYLLAGTGYQSVWRRLLSDYVGINPGSEIIPGSIILYQNFPNPFNPVTRIRYTIRKSSPVSLIVYDALGKKVQTLVSENQAPGTYEAVFDGSRLNSGVYYYKLTSNGYSETRKMVLIK